MQTSGRWRLIPALATAPAPRPMTYLAITFNKTTTQFEVSLKPSNGVFASTEHLEDARRIAQAIAAWTQLAVIEQ